MTTAASTPSRWPLDHSRWLPVAPLAERLRRIDGSLPVRLRADDQRIRLLAWLPSKALVGVSVRSEAPIAADPGADLVTTAEWLAGWLGDAADGAGSAAEPPRRDEQWLTPVPPENGWRRLEVLPGEVVRDLVRLGASAHEDAARLDLGARAADTLLDTPVVTVTAEGTRAELSNRSLSALVAMGFLPDGGEVVIAVCGRWTRASTMRGSVFAANRADGLGLL